MIDRSRRGSRNKSREELDNVEKEKGTLRQRLLAGAVKVADTTTFLVLTTMLTLYALFGDDFRLFLTSKAADVFFDAMTIFCILVFTVEICSQSFGKADYFWGFFFWLDLVSTTALLLDLTWILEGLYCADGDGLFSSSRGSRTGSSLQSAARTVRIIRLLRLVKLYRMLKVAYEKKKKDLVGEAATSPGESDEDALDEIDVAVDGAFGDETRGQDDGGDAGGKSSRGSSKTSQRVISEAMVSTNGTRVSPQEQNSKQIIEQSETRVGKKLTEMTTRRTVILVLVMLVFMPQFDPTNHDLDDFQTSFAIGAEFMYERWRYWCPSSTDGNPWCLQGLPAKGSTPTKQIAEARWWFEESLLTYLYAHRSGSWQVYWVGLASDKVDDGYVGQLGQLGQERYLGSRALKRSAWDDTFGDNTPEGNLVGSVKQKLLAPWVERCDDYTGVRLSSEVQVKKDPKACSLYLELRCTEYSWLEPLAASEAEKSATAFLFGLDKRPETRRAAGLNICMTIFIIIAVGIGSVGFTRDANKLLLQPIQRMVEKMETIKVNPLEAVSLGDQEFRRQQAESTKRKDMLARKNTLSRWAARASLHNLIVKNKEPIEMIILEKTIINLGGLLAMGFGEAGADVIGCSIEKGHQGQKHRSNRRHGSSNAIELNPTVAGELVQTIIGVCEVRDFSHAVEALEEEVMLLINQVAAIVHGCVDDYHGCANKNLGSSFLLIWRMTEYSDTNQKYADMSVMSFVRIAMGLRRSSSLIAYKCHPKIMQRLPDFEVKLGMALHYGWIIEGAIGSEFKIEAGYLSPNVNVTQRMQASTSDYDVPIVVSHWVIQLCSSSMASMCRLIDRVRVKCSRTPLRLFTVDLDLSRLAESAPVTITKMHYDRFKMRQVREVMKTEKLMDNIMIWEEFQNDESLVLCRSAFSKEFYQRFATAQRNYEAGQWMVARDLLYTCHNAVMGKTSKIEAKTVSVAPPLACKTSLPAVGHEMLALSNRTRAKGPKVDARMSTRSGGGRTSVAGAVQASSRTSLKAVARGDRKHSGVPPDSGPLAQVDGVMMAWPEDGPSRLLLRYMQSHGDFIPPDDWPGYRDLIESASSVAPVRREGLLAIHA